jgi:signal transduction histidine kinase/CheY-like chemotaxis protein/PAS domain-containing protein
MTNNYLHNEKNLRRIADLTSDTLAIFSVKGECLDIDSHDNLWFLQKENLLSKNIIDILPNCSCQKIMTDMQSVIDEKKTITKNYKIPLPDQTYYVQCSMYFFDGNILCKFQDITNRTNIEKKIKQANLEFSEIQEISRIGKWIFNVNTKTIFVSYNISNKNDSKNIELTVDQYLESIIPEDKDKMEHWIKLSVEKFNNNPISYRQLCDKSIYYYNIKCIQRLESAGKSIILKGLIQNITDIQRRRNDISTLTHVIHNVEDCVFAARIDGTFIFANHIFRKYYHIPEDDDICNYKTYNILEDISSIEEWEKSCEQLNYTTRKRFIHENPFQDNPKILAFEGVLYKITEDNGTYSYWSVAHDVTDRIHYESELKRFLKVLDTILDNLPASIIVKDIDHDYKYIYCNRAASNRNYFFSNITQFTGKTDFDVVPKEIAEKSRQQDIHIAETGESLHIFTEGKDREGNPIFLDKRKMEISNSQFSSMIIDIEWDITQQEKLKQETLEAKKKAEDSDRQKSTFVANMSHEIRTPLNAIVGFSKIIAESEDATDRMNYYKIVDENTERLLNLVNEILSLSKIEAGTISINKQIIDMVDVCRDVYDTCSFRCPKGVKLVNKSFTGRMLVLSDKHRIFEVFSNLITNAYKFTTSGNISFGFTDNRDFVECYVEDTGTGIASDKLDSIFNRFTRLNRNVEGTGLGLAISQSLVKLMGGSINVTSELGKGSIFTFTIPKGMKNEEVDDSKKTKTDKTIGVMNNSEKEFANKDETTKDKKKTILIAEDIDINFTLLQAYLKRDYIVARAHDGIEVVTIFDQLKPDLILMDCKMPNMNGLDATKVIHELSPNTPIIMQSAYVYEEDKTKALEAGCIDFLAKPIAKDKLINMLDKYLK